MPPKRRNNKPQKSRADSPALKQSEASSGTSSPRKSGSRSGAASPELAADQPANQGPLPDQKSVVVFAIGTEYASVSLLPTAPGARGEVIANEDGERRIPVVVGLDAGEESVGTPAKAHFVRNIRSTVRRFLPLIGLSYDDPIVQEAKSRSVVPLEPHPDEQDMPAFVLTTTVHRESTDADEDDEGEEKTMYLKPTDLLAMFLRTLKASAESFTGSPVTHCVLSHPVDFNSRQQAALVEAAKQANLVTLHVLPETSAALLMYESVDRSTPSASAAPKNTLLLDIGALTTTLSLFNVSSSLYTHLYHCTTALADHLGGTALDQALFTHFSTELKRKSKIDVASDRKATEKLLLACELTRRVLSINTTANCHVESLSEGMDFSSVVNRVRFETMCRKWKQSLTAFVQQSLDNAGFASVEVDEVVLLGGVSRTPFVARLIDSLFPRANVRSQVEPDECVALGCATHGLQMYVDPHMTTYAVDFVQGEADKHKNEEEAGVKHLRHPVGLLDAEGNFVVVLPRTTPIPVMHSFSIDCNGASSVALRWAEGRSRVPPPAESTADEDNDGDNDDDAKEEEAKKAAPVYQGTPLGDLVIRSNGRKLEKVDVTITLKHNGHLHISAHAAEKGANGQKIHKTLDIQA
ncbi:Hsp70 protein that interacts with Zuo1p [Sorochytrium milnesiophthora]